MAASGGPGGTWGAGQESFPGKERPATGEQEA